MYQTEENIVAVTSEDCSQLFFLYSGLNRTVGGMRALGFLKKSQLETRNVVMLIDPHKAGFRRGISEEVRSLDDIVTWQRGFLAKVPHVKQVYCVGVSAGSLPAMYSAYHLKADACWSFGARPPAEQYWGQDPEELWRIRAAARRAAPDPNEDPFEQHMLDPEIVAIVRELLLVSNDVTKYHLYYSPTNVGDSFVHTFLSDLPGAVSYQITAAPDYPHRQGPNWDHKVLPIIQHLGGLPELFPPFAAA